MSEPLDLLKTYHDHISRSIDEKGVYPHQMMCEDDDGKLGVYALMLNKPHEVLQAVLKALMEHKPKQLIYGLDRFCKSGQGTTLGDCIAGLYWNGEAWRPFIIEYQHEPRVVKPIDFDNQWWKKSLQQEWTDFLKRALLQE
jgi:hypothetical protein